MTVYLVITPQEIKCTHLIRMVLAYPTRKPHFFCFILNPPPAAFHNANEKKPYDTIYHAYIALTTECTGDRFRCIHMALANPTKNMVHADNAFCLHYYKRRGEKYGTR
jgi:hypothetical protein